MTTDSPRRSIVTLTTDFGDRDGYVGSLRGVLLAHDPNLVLADITHAIAPFAVMEGALVLRAAAGHFPPGTVHLAVVDPGVGGERRPIIVSLEGHHFVGPDNGLFTPFLDGASIVTIDAARLDLPDPAPTFHGRDLFAPVAARLATGAAPADFGPPIHDPVRLDWPELIPVEGGVAGVVLHVDRFGNAITNLPADRDTGLDTFEAGGRQGIPRVRTYAEAPRGSVVALVGSSGLIEVAVVEGSAAEKLGLSVGSKVIGHRAG